MVLLVESDKYHKEKIMKDYKYWNKEDVKFLKNNFTSVSDERLAQVLQRTKRAIQGKAHQLKLYKNIELGGHRRDIDDVILKKLYENGLSSPEIAEKMGNCNTSLVRWRLKKMGIPLRPRADAVLKARIKGRGHIFTPKRGKEHPNWKGGRIVEKNGHIRVWVEKHPRMTNHYVFEHIIIWEKHYKKRLPEGWIIHHLNGDPGDNHIKNLVALPNKKHWEIFRAKGKRIKELEKENAILKIEIKRLSEKIKNATYTC